jgi:hypothetical protein
MLLPRTLLIQFLVVFLKFHVVLVDEGTNETVLFGEDIMQDPLLQVFVGDVRRAHKIMLMVLRHDVQVDVFVVQTAVAIRSFSLNFPLIFFRSLACLALLSLSLEEPTVISFLRGILILGDVRFRRAE